MPDPKTIRGTRSAGRVPILLFLALIAAGGLLVVRSIWRAAASGPAGEETTFPELQWVQVAREKSAFVSSLRHEPESEIETLGMIAGLRLLARSLSTVRSGQLELGMTRTLARGERYDSKLELDFERHGERTELELKVERHERPSMTFSVELNGTEIVAASLSSPGFEEPVSGLEAFSELPVGLGDLMLSDLTGLQRAFEREGWRRLGDYQADNAERQWVFDIDLTNPESRGADSQPERQRTLAASALLYVDPLRALPNALYLFNAGELLVRAYEDLSYDPERGLFALESLRVTSFPNASHTTLSLGELELNKD